MAKVTYYYPWVYYDEDYIYKYGYKWSTSKTTFN